MARYLFAVWSFPGHINPNLAVANALRSRGHDVAFYTGERAATALAQLNITHFPMRHVDDEGIYRRHNLAANDDSVGRTTSIAAMWRSLTAMRDWLMNTTADQVADLEPILDGWHPDAIVSDANLLAPYVILHETRDIPVAILSFALGCILPRRDRLHPRDPYRRLYGGAERYIARRLAHWLQRDLDVLRRQYGLAPITGWAIDAAGAMPLFMVTSVPELDGERRDLPPTVHYVGRCAWDRAPDAPPPSWIADLSADRPLVYVTEGTVHGRQPKLLQAAAQGLANLPLQVLMTLNADHDPHAAGLATLPANVRLESYAPGHGWQSDIVPRASVVITNGGAGSALAALAAGVPQVVVPTVWDKPENAERIAAVGAGLQISTAACTPDGLRDAVRRVLTEPSFRCNARRIAEALRRIDGPVRAAELLEELCAVGSTV